VNGHQLLLNYCYGHPESPLLFYPYSPAVNFINHDSENPNAELRWSKSNQHRGRDWTSLPVEDVTQLNATGFMMEFVATRDIGRGEEIVINYGKEWEDAWKKHVDLWKPPPDAERYSPAYVMDEVISILRTEEEQRYHPYQENIITSCFYRYSDNKDDLVPSKTSSETTAVRWKMTRGLFEFENLRPCSILQRSPGASDSIYTVLIRNRFGLNKEERIPKGQKHIVTHVPRHAIRFTDKIYSSDQHLPNAFRHAIGIPDEIFPEQWKNVK